MRSDDRNRSHLPIPDRPRTGLITYDAKDPETRYPPIEQLRPPKSAPNVLVILIDDAGFGSASAFGGPCQTPNAERLAAGGLKYTRFHTTALCSPTRQALLTGRNHHSVGMGGITEIASGSPGYSSVLPNTAAPMPRPSSSMAMPRRSSANATRCRCGRRAPPGRSMPGPRAVAASSTSTASSVERLTNGTPRCTKGRRRSRSRRRPKRVTISWPI
jgi:Sulfatase